MEGLTMYLLDMQPDSFIQGPHERDPWIVERGAGVARHRRLCDGHEAQGRVRRAADHLQGGYA